MAKIGIMQPYFFPYLGYWQLLNAVDTYIVYDDVNYIKGGWVNRNRICINGEPHYFTLRLSGASPYKHINEISVTDDQVYLDKMIRMVEQTYKKAPYFYNVMPIVVKIIKNPQRNLALFLFDQIKIISEYLGIKTNLILSSSMYKRDGLHGEKRVIDMCHNLQATEYYNAIGGRDLYSKETFLQKNILLKFVKMKDIAYKQFSQNFVKNLSIIDIMMFNDKQAMTELLNAFEVL